MKVNVSGMIKAVLRWTFSMRDPSEPSKTKRALIADKLIQLLALLCGSVAPVLVLSQIELTKLIDIKNELQPDDIGLFLSLIFITLAIITLLYPFTILVCLIRRHWTTLVLAPLPIHYLLGLMLTAHIFDFKLEILQPYSQWLAIMVTGISLAWYAHAGRIFSKTFVIVFLLIYLIFPGIFAWLLLAMSLFLRYLLFAINQNIDVLRQIGWLRSARITLRSLLYWTPILAFAVPGYYWVDYSHRYSLGVMTCMVTDPDNTRVVSKDTNELTDCVEGEVNKTRSIKKFRSDTLAANKNFYATKHKNIERQISNSHGNLNNTALGAYDTAVPNRIDALEPRDCGLLDISCAIGNGVRSSVRSKYQSSRNQQRSKLKNNLGKGKTVVKQQTKGAINAVRDAHIKALETAFILLETLALICLITLLFLCLRSFLYVFARVAFGSDKKAYVSLRDDHHKMPHGSIRRAGSECIIDLARDGEFYSARKYQPQGQAPKFSLPQPGAVPLARLLNGTWGMNHLKKSRGSSRVQFSASQGQEFVVWNLKAGEVVVFDFKFFVAMSASLQLYSIISMRISSLLFGKIIFPAVQGPGKLVLKSYGKPSPSKISGGIAVSIAPGRLLAWQKNTRFAVDSTLSFVDVYLSSFYIRPQEHNLIVIDADRPGDRESGLSRFIKNFLLPW